MKVTIQFDRNDPQAEEWLKHLPATMRRKPARPNFFDPFELLTWLVDRAVMALVGFLQRKANSRGKPPTKSSDSTKTPPDRKKPQT